MADFTPTQGRYLAFIHAHTNLHGFPPVESEIAKAMHVWQPSVNKMMKTLVAKGFIKQKPRMARSIKILVSPDAIPAWSAQEKSERPTVSRNLSIRVAKTPAKPAASLYVVSVSLLRGRMEDDAPAETISRTIEIRGNQTLDDLHAVIFEAFERYDEHLYEFQFGKRPFDRAGAKYGVPEFDDDDDSGDATATTLDELDLKPRRVFFYWFDFGDSWMHKIKVDRIEQADSTVAYPRVIHSVGKAPPQYPEDDEYED